MQQDMFEQKRRKTQIGDGAIILHGFAKTVAAQAISEILETQKQCAFRHQKVRGNKQMSVASFNYGPWGWVSDARGYRYDKIDPETGDPWPPMPLVFQALAVFAAAEAGYPDFRPDACLVNCYAPGAHMTLHQDRDEADRQAPIVSVSLGLSARFIWGGSERGGALQRFILEHGDVVVWGGPSRLNYHGVDSLKDGFHPISKAFRYNLTFRKAR